ncbi:MAG TPA: AAA family ATPase [Rhodanobacteraceae bacterium]
MQQSIAKLFSIVAPESATLDVREVDPAVPAAAYPPVNPHYVFESTLLKKMLFLLVMDGPRKNVFLMGDTGVGKSSLVEQICARVGIPVFQVACSGKLRLAHLVGSYSLKEGNTVWQDGPLTRAMRHGGVFLADEITRMDHSEQMALAHVLDSGSITVPETGEIVVAAPGFRFVATGNSGGYGDDSGAYNGERVASVAFLDRFQKLAVDYLPPEREARLLESLAPELGDALIKRMTEFAAKIRSQFVSRGGALRVALSTRSMVVWALETSRYGSAHLCENPDVEALNDTVLNGAPADDAKSILEVWSNWTE